MPPLLHPPILALGYSEAAMSLQGIRAANIAAIISIFGRHEFGVEAQQITRRLDLHFDDVEVPEKSDSLGACRQWVHGKWAAEIGRPMIAPTLDDARAIIDFASSVEDIKGTLLCHCAAGISRAPAAALLCLATWTAPGQEQYCMDTLLRARPSAAPHRALIAWGDELLNRNGKLLAAINRHRQEST